jgi:hypothetical protein
MNNDLSPIKIDLTNKNKLDESWLRMFGWGVKAIIKQMFGDSAMPVSIRGSKPDLKSFGDTITKEKKYMDSYMKYGLDNPNTHRDKYKLDSAIKSFQRVTGLKWPLK